MIDNILYTLAMGMLYFTIFGGIAVWVLNYLLEQMEEIQAQKWTLVEVIVMLVVFFGIGLLVA
jgi:DMSO reductase anchor subunit